MHRGPLFIREAKVFDQLIPARIAVQRLPYRVTDMKRNLIPVIFPLQGDPLERQVNSTRPGGDVNERQVIRVLIRTQQ